MIRPDEILLAAGGRIMDRLGGPVLQSGRVERVTNSTFSRASVAWARVQRNKWLEVPAGVPRWEYDEGGRLALTLESTNAPANLLLDSANITDASASWTATSTETTFTGAGVSMLQGKTPRLFLLNGSTTAPSVYQDIALDAGWASLSAIVEESGFSTGFGMRLTNLGSTAVVCDAALAWDGTLTVTRSTEGGASTDFPLRSRVENLGYGPNGGRAYRATVSAPLAASGTIRSALFGVGLSATPSTSVRGTYLHHAQLTQQQGGGARVMVNPGSTTTVTRSPESFTIPKVNAAGGAMTIYNESRALAQPGVGGMPTLSTDSVTGRLALAKGWTSTGGKVYVGGAVYQRGARIVVVGSTGPAYNPGARIEEVVSISSGGVLSYEVAVEGGAVYKASSTERYVPSPRASIPKYILDSDQQVLVSVIARGAHSLEEFRSLFK